MPAKSPKTISKKQPGRKVLNRKLATHKRPLILAGILLFASVGTYMLVVSQAATDDKIRIATYNILGSNHVDAGNQLGTVNERATRAAAIIKGNAGVAEVHIVGMQELRSDQYALFKEKMPGYSTYPANNPSQKTIFWKTKRFTKLDSGKVDYPGYGDDNLDASSPALWVQLRDEQTGKRFFVLNHHAVAWNESPGSDKGGAQKREKTAKIIASWVSKQTLPVVVLGDMNSATYIRDFGVNYFKRTKDDAIAGNRDRLPYCILTQNSNLRYSRDLARGITGKCPTKDDGLIDSIYLTKGDFTVTGWNRVTNATAKSASDHRPIIVGVIINSTSGGVASSFDTVPLEEPLTRADDAESANND